MRRKNASASFCSWCQSSAALRKTSAPLASSEYCPVAGVAVSCSNDVVGLLHDHLAPHVGPRELLPALVDLVDVQVEVDVHVLEDVEQEQRHVGVGARGDVGDRRRPADPRVELAQVDLVRVGVDEDVDLEEAAVALLGQPVAQAPDQSVARVRCVRR